MIYWRFKPYYNWNTFNTFVGSMGRKVIFGVLNLIITGIPSIPVVKRSLILASIRFKPYYNWNTFNTIWK